MYSAVTVGSWQYYCIVYLKFAKRGELKCSQHTHKKCNSVR